MFGIHQKIFSFLFGLLLLISFTSYAQPPRRHIIVAPVCLLNHVNGDYQSLATSKSLQLIATNDAGIEQLILAKNARKNLCGGFIDVSHAWNQFNNRQLTSSHHEELRNANSFLLKYENNNRMPIARNKIAYEIKYQKQVAQLFTQLNAQEMWGFLTTLSNFKDRYANSDNGVKAAGWLKTQIETFAKDNNRDDVNVYTIATNGYQQPSVVAKIGNSSGPGIVISAHMDTLSSNSSKKPGADDDGTGSVTVLEIAKTLLSSGMNFKKPIYLIWYAAEEQGLVGSGYVVEEFTSKHIPVDAVLHFDLTGYANKNDPTMWLIDDYVNKDLSAYLGKLIDTYVKQPVKHTRCGYACSDHASWTDGGYAAAIPAESAYEDTNPNIHSSMDTMDKLSLSHMTDYLKLATAFAVEMAEPAGV